MFDISHRAHIIVHRLYLLLVDVNAACRTDDRMLTKIEMWDKGESPWDRGLACDTVY